MHNNSLPPFLLPFLPFSFPPSFSPSVLPLHTHTLTHSSITGCRLVTHSTYLDLERGIESHPEVLPVSVLSKHLLPCLLEQCGVERVSHYHVPTAEEENVHWPLVISNFPWQSQEEVKPQIAFCMYTHVLSYISWQTDLLKQNSEANMAICSNDVILYTRTYPYPVKLERCLISCRPVWSRAQAYTSTA